MTYLLRKTSTNELYEYSIHFITTLNSKKALDKPFTHITLKNLKEIINFTKSNIMQTIKKFIKAFYILFMYEEIEENASQNAISHNALKIFL